MKLTQEVFQWQDAPQTQHLLWRAENDTLPPKRFILADDTLTADTAYKLACEGCGLFWQGDFQNARQLLQALARRCDRPVKKSRKKSNEDAPLPAQLFNLHRQAQSQRARVLAMVLIPLNNDYTVPLKRAPDVVQACKEAYGDFNQATPNSIVSLRELQGLVGAHEWCKKGVAIPELDGTIYPHYGVFSPVRGEYISLIANTPLPDNATALAFDIGTGTGILAALLAKRGVKRVVATDQDPRAITCAEYNLQQLQVDHQVELVKADLFPLGKAPLIVCNPPWVPARPSSPIEYAIFDPESRMLKGFLTGLAEHLDINGEGWLILSDLAEHLGLRSRAELLDWIDKAQLQVIERIDVKPTHPKLTDTSDLLHIARESELTSLWRLAAKKNTN